MQYEVEFIFLGDNGEELTSRDETIFAESISEANDKANDLCNLYGADEYNITGE